MTTFVSRPLETCEIATALLQGQICVIVKGDVQTRFMSPEDFEGLTGISPATHTVYNVTVEKSSSGVHPVEITTVYGVGSTDGQLHNYVLVDAGIGTVSHGTRLEVPGHKTYLRFVAPVSAGAMLAMETKAPVAADLL